MTTVTGEPSTIPERPDRRSSRERRIQQQQQRAKLEAFTREQRRKRFALGTLAVVALAAAVAIGIFVVFPRPTALRVTRCDRGQPPARSHWHAHAVPQPATFLG